MTHDENSPFDEKVDRPPEERTAPDPFQELERMFSGLLDTSAPAPTAPLWEAEAPQNPAETAPPPAEAPADETPAEASGMASVRAPEKAAEADSEIAPVIPTLDALVATLDASTPSAILPDLVAASTPSAHGSSARRHIVFLTAGTRYALEIGQVIEVGTVPPITPLPGVPKWLLGVSNLRGDILAVLDFRQFLGHGPQGAADRHRMLVLQAGTAPLTAGLVVDQVFGVGSVDPAAVRPPIRPVENNPVHQFLVGVLEVEDELVGLLDAEKLLTSRELRPFAETALDSELTKPRESQPTGTPSASSPHIEENQR